MSDTAVDGLARNQAANSGEAPAASGQPAPEYAHEQFLQELLKALQTAREKDAAPAAHGPPAHGNVPTETAPKPPTLRQLIAAEKGHPGRALLTAAQTAREVYGISERKFHDLRAKGLVPDPVVLGERSLRWVRNECEAHVLTLPRQRGTQEVPPQLRRKIERIKATGQVEA